MSADVGFTPGKLIEAAQGIGATAEPISQSVAPMGEDITSLSAGLNGSYMEPLGNAMTAWGDSLLCCLMTWVAWLRPWWAWNGLFPRVRMRSSSRWFRLLPVRSRVMMARPRVVCTRSCRLWLGKVLMEANSEQRFDAGVPGG